MSMVADPAGEANPGRGATEAVGHPPTPDGRASERAVALTLLGDCLIFLLRLPLLLTGSLTVLSDVLRACCTFGASAAGYVVLRRVRRGRMRRFEFGVGKFEQGVTLLAGIALMISGLWVVNNAIAAVFGPVRVASPFGLAAAAVFNALNLSVNISGLIALLSAPGARSNPLVANQIETRAIRAACSLVLQVTLTAAALAKDPAIASIMDTVGASFVAGIMLFTGVPMITQALPALLDAPALPRVEQRIRHALADAMPEAAEAAVRTRRSGRITRAEVTLPAAAFGSGSEFHRIAAEIRAALESDAVEIEFALSGTRNPVR